MLHNLLRCTSIHIADLPAKVVSNLEVIFPVSRVPYNNEIDISEEFWNILEKSKKDTSYSLVNKLPKPTMEL